jgi:hypothetical protein
MKVVVPCNQHRQSINNDETHFITLGHYSTLSSGHKNINAGENHCTELRWFILADLYV